MTMTNLLIAAYQNTHYVVHDANGDFVLKVNQRSLALNNLYQKHGVNSAAFISAYNPYSQITSAESNAKAHAELCKILSNTSYIIYQGLGVDPTQKWESEKSLLLMGISLSKACQLGVDVKQNAILFADEIAIPRLILL